MSDLPVPFPPMGPMGPMPPMHPQMLPPGQVQGPMVPPVPLQHPALPPQNPLQFQHAATPPIPIPPFAPQPLMPMSVPYMSGQPLIPVPIPLQMETLAPKDTSDKRQRRADRKVPSPEKDGPPTRPLKRLRKKIKKKCPWSEHKAPDGRMYYYNSAAKESVWQKPPDLLLPAERELRLLPWKEHKSDSGRSYFYNSDTKKSTWDIPTELERLKAVAEAEREHSLAGLVLSRTMDNQGVILARIFKRNFSRRSNQ